jgi:hypothetical protein
MRCATLLTQLTEDAASKNVQNRKQENPDHIDKVPIEAHTFQKTMTGWRHLPHESSNQRSNKKEHTDKNVHPVKTGENKEARSHDSGGIEPETFVIEIFPFVGLVRQKERPKDNGR